jgi:PleD family two-component response regulator
MQEAVMEDGAKILLVDDSLQDLRIHAATLARHGYRVVSAGNAEEALLLAEADAPDLFLIASRMEHIDGFELCERLKQDPRLVNTPVVFITKSSSAQEIDRSFSAGGVDYIQKPCHLSEFLARVRTHIRLYRLLREVEDLREAAIDSNPLTHLPGNNTIVSQVEKAVADRTDVCVIYADLDNFKAYNDAYGFSDGDDVLLFTAETLHTVLRVVCQGEGFLGHVGGDDFVLIVPSDMAETVGQEITNRFDRGVPDFYSDEDRARGYIKTADRRGQRVKVPFISISLGGVVLRRREFTRSVEVFSVCADVKKAAKAVPGSNLFLDRRTGERRSNLRREEEPASLTTNKLLRD